MIALMKEDIIFQIDVEKEIECILRQADFAIHLKRNRISLRNGI
jgi:hypothetical protein